MTSQHSTDVVPTLTAWAADPDPSWLHPAVLRLAARVPELRPTLDRLLSSPLQRALAGLAAPPEDRIDLSLGDAVLTAVATMDRGGRLPAERAAALEKAATGDATWWVPATRVHVLASEARERQARAAASEQELPYVFPGDLHPLMVDVLASADRVFTALHVDWMRKLTSWVADAAVADARAVGMWFWPHLRFMSEKRLTRPLGKLARVRRAPPGARGMALAYQYRIGMPWARGMETATPADRFVAAVAIASDRVSAAPAPGPASAG